MRKLGVRTSRIVLALLLLGVGAGCGTTRAVGPRPSEEAIGTINDAGRGKSLSVRYRSEALVPPPLGGGRSSFYEGGYTRIAVADDGRIRLLNENGSDTTVSTHLIREVSVIDRWRGAARGALFGAVAGVVLGALFGLAEASSCDQWCVISTEASMAGGALLFGLGGTLVGAGGGALVGYRETFVFNDAP